MNKAIQQVCSLTPLQQAVIKKGIQTGFREFAEYLMALPPTPTNNYKPKLRSDIINNAVEREVINRPEAGLTVEYKKASFHEYIVLRDMSRQVSILVQHLPENRQIMPQSKYRGEFAMYNIDRLISEGFSDLDIEQLEIDLDDYKQTSLPLEPEFFQFCIVVCYDGNKGAEARIFEGALAPNQDKWIYRREITGVSLESPDHYTPVEETRLPKLKPEFAEPNYGLKLKNVK
ncbi:hypothetical protein [Paenibacillus sp. 7541]|uniref:hypothetical protein n=1 Tax=Paenibacillus sp. 7541 TaxID=2026236 RepID=UPI000BA5DAAD|nr:hypothetical protein [Paenibacillus sp. 7541]PAK50726.1 hypothetical protein CHH75_17115 [Paenibacillus sp. 7541]